MRIWAVLALVTGLLSAPSRVRSDPATRPAATTTAEAPPTTTRQAAAREVDRPKPLLLDQTGKTPGLPDTSKLLWQMLAYVLVILLLGGVAIFVFKRVLPRIRRVAGKRVCVVETTYLGPRQTVQLLQVGNKKFLLGGTRERISMLAEVTGAFPEQADEPLADDSGKEAASR